MGDEKRRILERRAAFVAAALAATSGCHKPEPCLSVAYVGDASAPPEPCLAVSLTDTGAADVADDTSTDAADASDAKSDAPAPKPMPHPCLSLPPPQK
jgi:hypothetical protein